MSGEIIRLEKLYKQFGGLSAVSNLDMAVEEGKVHGLIGPNGSGKTTTLNLISGVYRPSGGRIHFLGRQVQGLPPSRLTREGISRTFQNIRLFRRLTVLENVMLARHCRTKAGLWDSVLGTRRQRAEEAETRQTAMEILSEVGLDQRAGSLPGDLPYGRQRLLEIARALATGPRLLLLDEPAAGMTAGEKTSLMDLIRRINTGRGITILIIDHDMRVIMNVCQSLTVLNFGSKIGEGRPEEIRRNPEVIEAYLGKEDALAGTGRD